MNRSASATSSRTFMSPHEVNRCSICKEYLSVGPITQAPNSTYACGRCSAIGNNVDYYNTSNTLFLPCRYDMYGCHTFIKYGDVLWHENRCTFKPITCPAIGCDWNIAKTQLLQHFRETHQELIITTRDLSISTLSNFENRLYVWENQPLIVQTRISGIFLYIRITTIENRHIHNTRLFYRVKWLDKIVPVSLYTRKVPQTGDMLKLNLRQLDTYIFFDIYDRKYERLTSNYLDSNCLSGLRCSVCDFYALPTTYTCKNRHKFCNTCIQRLQACTICQTGLKKAFSLKHLGRFLDLPCYYKNQGCKFVQKPQEITRHEQEFHVWNLSEVKCVNIGEEIFLNLHIESFYKTLYADCQGTLLKIVISYTKSRGMEMFIVATNVQYVGQKYDLEVSAEDRKLWFEGQTLGIDSQNDTEYYVRLNAESLEYVMDSCGGVKLRFRLIAYR